MGYSGSKFSTQPHSYLGKRKLTGGLDARRTHTTTWILYAPKSPEGLEREESERLEREARARGERREARARGESERREREQERGEKTVLF